MKRRFLNAVGFAIAMGAIFFLGACAFFNGMRQFDSGYARRVPKQSSSQ